MGVDLGIIDLSGAKKSKNVTEAEKSEIKPMTQTHPMIGRNLRIDSDRLWQNNFNIKDGSHDGLKAPKRWFLNIQSSGHKI